MAFLEVDNLEVSFVNNKQELKVLKNISFSVEKGEIIGIVGESGAGKSVTAYSILQALGDNGRILNGSVKIHGKELIGLLDKELEIIRRTYITAIFQNPSICLNPVFTIENQMLDVMKLKNKINKRKARNEIIELLNLVGIDNPNIRLKQYPYELSGGMCQRIMIAMAIINKPEILIADEPTTSLDVTVQAQILELLKKIQKETKMSIIFISHDLGVIASICDKIIVMYNGKIVEKGSLSDIIYNAKHQYTKDLLSSLDKLKENSSIKANKSKIMNKTGCPYAYRCSKSLEICFENYPIESEFENGHFCSCWLNELNRGEK